MPRVLPASHFVGGGADAMAFQPNYADAMQQRSTSKDTVVIASSKDDANDGQIESANDAVVSAIATDAVIYVTNEAGPHKRAIQSCRS